MTDKGHFRSSPRPHVACKVTLYHSQSSPVKPVVSFTRDIGTGGLFVETDEAFEIGDRVEVVLSAPSAWEPLILDAEVCRVESFEKDDSGGVGLRFVNTTDTQLMALISFTESLDFES